MESTLFDKPKLIMEKFKNFFMHKKKLSALENYSLAVPFQHKDFLTLIKHCMADGFLGEKEAEFLCYMVERYEIKVLDWAHKTKWLKGEISRLSAENRRGQAAQQMHMFDYPSRPAMTPSNVPFELLAQQQRTKQMAGRL